VWKVTRHHRISVICRDDSTGASIGGVSTAGSRFYAVNDRPVAVVPTPDGGADCTVFDFATGELVPDRSYFGYLTPGSGRDVDVLTEAEFAARLAAYRADAADRAVARVRQWAGQLCRTAGDAVPVAAALGFHGSWSRGDITVDRPSAGYSAVKVKTLSGNGAAVELRPAGRLLTRGVLDAEFGPGREIPMNPGDYLLSVAYRAEVTDAAAYCTIFAGFKHPDVTARQIMLRRDTLR
jgi:hypothetical protein